jgi:hypothetical protein
MFSDWQTLYKRAFEESDPGAQLGMIHTSVQVITHHLALGPSGISQRHTLLTALSDLRVLKQALLRVAQKSDRQ